MPSFEAGCQPADAAIPADHLLLAGFVATFLLFAAAIEADYAWLAAVAAINTVVSIVYYVRVVAPAYFDQRPDQVPTLARLAAISTVAMGLARSARPRPPSHW